MEEGKRFVFAAPNKNEQYIDEDVIRERKKREESLRKAAIKLKRKRNLQGTVSKGARKHSNLKQRANKSKKVPAKTSSNNNTVDPISTSNKTESAQPTAPKLSWWQRLFKRKRDTPKESRVPSSSIRHIPDNLNTVVKSRPSTIASERLSATRQSSAGSSQTSLPPERVLSATKQSLTKSQTPLSQVPTAGPSPESIREQLAKQTPAEPLDNPLPDPKKRRFGGFGLALRSFFGRKKASATQDSVIHNKPNALPPTTPKYNQVTPEVVTDTNEISDEVISQLNNDNEESSEEEEDVESIVIEKCDVAIQTSNTQLSEIIDESKPNSPWDDLKEPTSAEKESLTEIIDLEDDPEQESESNNSPAAAHSSTHSSAQTDRLDLIDGDMIEEELPNRTGSTSRLQNIVKLKTTLKEQLKPGDPSYADWIRLIESGFTEEDQFEVDPKYEITVGFITSIDNTEYHEERLRQLLLELERDISLSKSKTKRYQIERQIREKVEKQNEEERKQIKEERGEVLLSFKEQKEADRRREKEKEAKRLREFVKRFPFDPEQPTKTPEIESPAPSTPGLGDIAEGYEYDLRKKTQEFQLDNTAVQSYRQRLQTLSDKRELMWEGIESEFIN